MKKIYSEMTEEELEDEFQSHNKNCDFCKNKLEDISYIKSIVAYETKFDKNKEVGWRRIMNKTCCDKCYNKIVREAGASGIF